MTRAPAASNRACWVRPSVFSRRAAATYADIEYGRTSAEMAFMTGKIKVSNVGEMMRFVKLFEKVQG